MVDGDSMGPGLQLVGVRFLNFLLGSYSHRVGHAASPTRAAYVDLTLIPSKIKVKVKEHLNFDNCP